MTDPREYLEEAAAHRLRRKEHLKGELFHFLMVRFEKRLSGLKEEPPEAYTGASSELTRMISEALLEAGQEFQRRTDIAGFIARRVAPPILYDPKEGKILAAGYDTKVHFRVGGMTKLPCGIKYDVNGNPDVPLPATDADLLHVTCERCKKAVRDVAEAAFQLGDYR
jgi:hypothetical protein